MAGRSQQADPEELKDAFKRAAEIAAVVPEAMQEAAFHRALDEILGRDEPSAKAERGRSQRRAPRASPDEESPAADPAQELIDEINRTAYPEVPAATKVLDRALAVLRLASRDFDVDGLTAPQIAKVLTAKFRLRTSRQAVTQAVGSAHTLVDTVKRGGTTVYRIMQPGEEYLDAGGSTRKGGETVAPKPSRRRKRKAPQPRAPASRAEKPDGEERGETTIPRRSRRRGPKTMLSELIDEGFFSQSRTISDAQQQLRHKKGVRFTLQDLSPAFVRLLREGRFDRDRNESGQYEYTAS